MTLDLLTDAETKPDGAASAWTAGLGCMPPARSGMWTPIWKHGAGKRAAAPARLTNTEYARRWRHKVGNARAAPRRDIVRMENTPPPTFPLPAEIRNWLTGVPA